MQSAHRWRFLTSGSHSTPGKTKTVVSSKAEVGVSMNIVTLHVSNATMGSVHDSMSQGTEEVSFLFGCWGQQVRPQKAPERLMNPPASELQMNRHQSIFPWMRRLRQDHGDGSSPIEKDNISPESGV